MFRNMLWLCVVIAGLSLASCGDGVNQSAQNQEQVIPPAPPGAEPGPDEVIKVDELSVPLKTVNPVYPGKARREGVEGTVWVNVPVNNEGTVTEASVIQREGGSEELEQAALDGIRQWALKPAKISENPVSIWVAVPVRFKLAEK